MLVGHHHCKTEILCTPRKLTKGKQRAGGNLAALRHAHISMVTPQARTLAAAKQLTAYKECSNPKQMRTCTQTIILQYQHCYRGWQLIPGLKSMESSSSPPTTFHWRKTPAQSTRKGKGKLHQCPGTTHPGECNPKKHASFLVCVWVLEGIGALFILKYVLSKQGTRYVSKSYNTAGNPFYAPAQAKVSLWNG